MVRSGLLEETISADGGSLFLIERLLRFNIQTARAQHILDDIRIVVTDIFAEHTPFEGEHTLSSELTEFGITDR